MKKIGFIGLGHMGNPMVKNLLKADYSVKVYDIFSAAREKLVQDGAIDASSLQDVIHDVEIVITMLQTSDQVKEVAEVLFQTAKKDFLYIDCSSIEIAMAKKLHEEAEKQNIAMLDAPVSGGVVGATAGTLTFMVGGTEENFLRAKPLLEKMGKKIIHAGRGSLGQAAKICNNLILGISMIAVSEGFALAEKLGLDTKKFFEISSNSSGQCWSMTSYCPAPGVVESAPSNHDYKPGFTANMMLKDLRLGERAAEGVQASIPLGEKAEDLYSLFVKEGHGEMDFSGIITMLKDD